LVKSPLQIPAEQVLLKRRFSPTYTPTYTTYTKFGVKMAENERLSDVELRM